MVGLPHRVGSQVEDRDIFVAKTSVSCRDLSPALIATKGPGGE